MNDLCIGHIHIQTTKVINNGNQCIKVYGCIICNVQVKVCIQHVDCLFCITCCISCISLTVHIITDVEKCISIYRYKLNIFGIIVDTGNDHGITVFVSGEVHVFASGIKSEQCISGISCQTGSLRIYGILNFFINLDLTFIQHRLIDLVQLGIKLSIYIKTTDE